MRRRTFLGMVIAVGLAGVKTAGAEPIVDVYKSPTCGCCGNWSEHLRASGFSVNVRVNQDMRAFRARAGVPEELASCHTALVDGYVIEGHVPAQDIWRLLAARPKALGLVVPGMPATAPGMDAPHGDGYDVLLLQADGATRVYRSYSRT